MRIDARDFDHLAVALAEVGPRTFKAAAMVTEKAARDIERDAKAFAPVDTGNLRSSIGTDLTVDASRISATIGATADYAAYVEYGTSTMAPHAHLGPAYDRHVGEWADALDRLMGGMLG